MVVKSLSSYLMEIGMIKFSVLLCFMPCDYFGLEFLGQLWPSYSIQQEAMSFQISLLIYIPNFEYHLHKFWKCSSKHKECLYCTVAHSIYQRLVSILGGNVLVRYPKYWRHANHLLDIEDNNSKLIGTVPKYWRLVENLLDIEVNGHDGVFKIYKWFIWRSTTSRFYFLF